MKPSIHSWENLLTKSFCCCSKKITQTKPRIKMMQLLLFQLARHLDIGKCGDWIGFPFNFSPFSREFLSFSSQCSKFQKANLFQGNLKMALFSFGGVNDQCGATSWTVQETGMFPSLSSNNDMTEGQVEGLRCVQGRRTW